MLWPVLVTALLIAWGIAWTLIARRLMERYGIRGGWRILLAVIAGLLLGGGAVMPAGMIALYLALHGALRLEDKS